MIYIKKAGDIEDGTGEFSGEFMEFMEFMGARPWESLGEVSGFLPLEDLGVQTCDCGRRQAAGARRKEGWRWRAKVRVGILRSRQRYPRGDPTFFLEWVTKYLGVLELTSTRCLRIVVTNFPFLLLLLLQTSGGFSSRLSVLLVQRGRCPDLLLLRPSSATPPVPFWR